MTGGLRVATGTTTSDGQRNCVVWESTDEAVSWSEVGPCTNPTVANPEPCTPDQGVESLCVLGDEVSFDSGQSWQPIEVDATIPGDQNGVNVTDVVELQGGGWLAEGSTSEAGDISYGTLIRSEDGVRWEQVLPEPCDEGIGRPNSAFSEPAPIGDKWLVTAECDNLTSPVHAELYVLSASGEDPQEVPDTRVADTDYGRPVSLDGTVLITVDKSDDGRMDEILRFRG